MNTDNKISVSYGKAVYDQKEIDVVIKVMKNTLQMGANVQKMEAKVAELFVKKYGIMVNSGSSANYLAIEVLDLPEGSEIITPVLTFITTVAPIVRNNLIPVFVDVELDTYNIDVNQIETSITKRTKALMIPSLLGNLPNWAVIRDIADKYNLVIIEDSADTLGATIDKQSTGKYSDISTTSFYGSHIITCAGNGGMICINDCEAANKAKLLRGWGRSSSLLMESEAIEDRFNVHIDNVRYDAKFIFERFGYNFLPSEIGAAFGLIQLEKLQNNIDIRTKWFNQHTNFMKQYEDFFILPKQLNGSRTAWLAYPLIVKDSAPFTRTDMQIFLEERNIQTRTVLTGNILRQPCFTNNSSIKYVGHKDNFKNTDQVTRGGILIGCHNGLTNQMLDHLYYTISKFMKRYV